MSNPWQPDYSLRDHEIVDYGYWELPGSGIRFRGPEVNFEDPAPYLVCAGAAQTFGCFVARPYPTLLAEQLGMRVVNLGLGSATPSVFSSNDRLLEVINGGQVLVLQVMAARQETNSRLEQLGTDLVHDSRHGDQIPAHMAWQRILDEEPAELDRYIAESQKSWTDDYRELLGHVRVPVVLFFFSVREKDITVARDAPNAHAMLEPFPQLVEGASVDTVAAQCDHYVECTSTRNHKHALTSRFTGEPVEVDNSVLDPRMRNRWRHNWYYPSPEMHEDAAANLLPVLSVMRSTHA
ncbi:DUF6473 family protein [Mycobacterium sp. URHB0044]|uniref:DUF6473 family protein n=1 Tax=Mycobacterium sp. URHB0044 TaxID=1380386 RepID=UPI0004903E12|nr:DUF6473 family protein [Mycobacterium sp. URHB0044]